MIGAATPGAMVEAHAGMNKAWPGLVEALDLIGSTQIQGRCSLAGNLCNASPAADSVPAMYAAGAIAVVVGGKGRREVPVSRSPGPGRTSLAKDEFILEFKLPPRPARTGDTPTCGSFRAQKWISRWLAGHQRDVGRKGRLHRSALGPGRGGADVLLVEDSGRYVYRAHARGRHAGETGCGGASGVQTDRRQARNDRLPHQGGRRAGPPGGGHRLRSRTMGSTIAREDSLMSKPRV